MRILADENFPRPVVVELRRRGHDVLWVRTDCPGTADADLLANAQRESRIVVTQDKGFGDLAFHAGLPSDCGVVLFRLKFATPEAATSRIVAALEGRAD